VRALIGFLHQIQSHKLDDGAEGFQPSNLEVVTMDVGNPATNVIPEKATARFNIRFNTAHTGESLSDWLRAEAQRAQVGFNGKIDLSIMVSGEAFFTPPGLLTHLIQDSCDARFIKDYCPVCEFGLVGATMHQVNERVETRDIETLTDIYEGVLARYFDRV
jgi:succinyl-diaminopimelate desuccinylase